MAKRNWNAVTEAMDGARQDFDAAQDSRFVRRRTGIPADGSGADYHERSETLRLKRMEYARDLCRNSPAIGQGLERAVDNTIQGGFELDINTGDSGLDDELLARWEEWSTDPSQCDASGENTFVDFEEMLLGHVFMDGDVFAYGTDDGTLQTFEAHRCRQPKTFAEGTTDTKAVVLGVELDELRRRLAFHICGENLDPSRYATKKTEFRRLESYDANHVRRMFQIHRAKRLTQTRGVTAFAPVYHLATMLEDSEFAAAFKAQLSACFVLFEESVAGFQMPGTESQTGERTTEQRADGSTKIMDGVNPGLKYITDPGKKLTGFNHQVMGPEFVVHMEWMLQEIGLNLGLPLCMLLMDPSKGNFSSQRAAVEMARLGFRQNQRRYSRRFHTPTLLWQVSLWMAADSALKRSIDALQAKRPKNFVGTDGADLRRLYIPHEWGFPAWPYIEVIKDRQANIMNVGNCMQSAREADSATNRRYFTKVDRIIEEREIAYGKAMDAAKRINVKYPDNPNPFRWDHFFVFPSPDGIRTSFAGSADDKADAADPQPQPQGPMQ